jgi:uncharacterized repeat protein (TIGR03803 family)
MSKAAATLALAFGGANASGTVFEITANGGLTTLYSFCSQAEFSDGKCPIAGLIQASLDFHGALIG